VNYKCEGSGKWTTIDGIKIVVTPESLYKSMARADLGVKYHIHIREMICQVWGVDAPYSWHLERAIMRYGPNAFVGNEAFCLQFAEWYIGEIQAIEDHLMEVCGVPLSFHV
jgi:hypothetical protein